MLRTVSRFFLNLCLCCAAPAMLSAQGWQHAGNVQKVDRLPDGVELSAGKAKVRVTAFREGIFRVRVAPSGAFPKDFSWAVTEAAQPPAIKIDETRDEVRVAAGGTIARIHKSPLLVDFLNDKGEVLVADNPDLPMAWADGQICVWKRMPQDEGYYGLGDKAGPMNRRNRAFTMWNTDAYAWQESTDPLYKTIPFFIGLRKGVAYGIFFDNTWRSSFDFGKASHDSYSFGAEGGEINYYFFAGPTPKKIVEDYTALVGHTPLPPLWTLGFQQSRYSYEPEARVYEVAKTFRDKKIPVDAIYLDIDYQNGNAPFTVDRNKFPTFDKMISDLTAQGIHTVLITDLHIKKDASGSYAPYDTGAKEDVFLKRADGSTYVGTVWPGESVFPDFTLSRARDWWGGLYKNFADLGVSGFWNDMNEPAIFLTSTKTMPLDVRHRLDDGTALPHLAIHNVFGMENVRATSEGLLKLRPNERPFVLTRAAYAGAQRYAATWTGDNVSTWNHLGMSTPMLLSMGLSGYGMVGDDIGGFAGSPTAELLTRWIETGAFNPIYRDHTSKGTADQEPWVHGAKHEAIRKHFIEERYRLLPYIYTSVEEMTRTGIPLMRPLFLEYPQLTEIFDDDHEYLFGPDLFVSPVTTELQDTKVIQLPPGVWYDYWTGEKTSDRELLKMNPALDQVPVYVRAGAIVPRQPLVQSTSETPNGPLELRVYPGQDCQGSLYQDDGHSLNFTRGEFLRVNYSCQVGAAGIKIISSIDKDAYKPWWTAVEISVFGLDKAPQSIRVGDSNIRDWHYDASRHSAVFTLTDAKANWNAELIF
ncbi:MAG TPA: glycoside hydrolase family 31 protein [Candidatus Acidoferrum sp.]|nr:glycoside hydrolase family 31 protein [Candidatus Acidoferrum sp.]